MKVKLYPEEISKTIYIPFDLEVNGKIYSGILIRFITSVGGWKDYFIELTWEDEEPEIDKETVFVAINEELEKEDITLC